MENTLKFDAANFSNGDHIIMNFILHNEEKLLTFTAQELAHETGLSNSTVCRFWTKIGYKNIKDFREFLVSQRSTAPSSKIHNTLSDLSGAQQVETQILRRDQQCLEKTMTLIQPGQFEACAHLIVKCQRIYVLAPDASRGVALILQFRLRRFGFELIFIENGSEIYDALLNIRKEDLVFVFCFSHLINEIKIILLHRQSIHYHVILITDLLTNDLDQQSDQTLYCYRGNVNEYHTMVSALALIDCLVIHVALISKASVKSLEALNELRSTYQSYIKR